MWELNIFGWIFFSCSCLFIIGDYERAEEFVVRFLRWGSFVGFITDLMQIQGKFQESLQFADSICQQGECGLLCSLALFEVSLLLGDFEKAEQYFYQWHEAGPSSFSEYMMNYGIGYVYFQLGETEEAKAFAEEIEKLESEVDRDRWAYLPLPDLCFHG